MNENWLYMYVIGQRQLQYFLKGGQIFENLKSVKWHFTTCPGQSP
jgi:hypothetical protein